VIDIINYPFNIERLNKEANIIFRIIVFVALTLAIGKETAENQDT